MPSHAIRKLAQMGHRGVNRPGANGNDNDDVTLPFKLLIEMPPQTRDVGHRNG